MNVFAYLDAGTGSYVFQLLMATALGGLFALKLCWRQVKLRVAGLRTRGRKT